jgi:hypothetical protein
MLSNITASLKKIGIQLLYERATLSLCSVYMGKDSLQLRAFRDTMDWRARMGALTDDVNGRMPRLIIFNLMATKPAANKAAPSDDVAKAAIRGLFTISF